MQLKRITSKIKDRGIFKTHNYTSYRIAPSVDNNNEFLDTLIKSLHSIRNDQMFKNLRDGQSVVALEIYADHNKAYYMYTVPTTHKLLLYEKFQSGFKGAGIKEYQHLSWPFNISNDEMNQSLLANLTLSKSTLFPLQMKETAQIYKDIIHVINDIKTKEKLFVQILLEPIEDGWQREMEKAYEEYLHGEDDGDLSGLLKSGGRQLDRKISSLANSFSKNTEKRTLNRKHREMKEVRDKIRQSGFQVSVRLMVYADNYNRRNDIIEGLAAAFKNTDYYNGWKLSPVIFKKSGIELLQTRRIALTSRSILCNDEVKGLLRFPTREIESKRLERMRPDESTVDDRITRKGKIIPVGYAIEFDSQGEAIGFDISQPDTASKGRLWIAPPGSGKSTMVKTFKNGAMDAGHGGSIFDVADGKLYYEAIESTPPKDRNRLVLVDFTNEKYPAIFNFDNLGSDADDIGMMFAEFFEIYFKTQNFHRMNSFLRKAAQTNFANPDHTFLELIMLMRDEDFRKKFLPTIRKSNPELFLWWKQEFPKIAKSEAQMNEILQPILYRLDELQYNKRLGPIFCGRGGKLQISKWINEGKWILYNLSNGYFLEFEQRMLMSFLNYAYWTATLKREKFKQQGIEPIIHHKMYDEPQTYMTATPVFELSISKSRKYRVSDNFLIQNPSQIIKKDPDLWRQIIGMNPHILVGGGLDNDNLKEMARVLNIKVEELKQLEHLEYHWYFKTYVGKEALPAFIFDGKGIPKEYGRDKALEIKWQQAIAPIHADDINKDKSARNLNLTIPEYEALLASYDTEVEEEEEGVPLGEDS